jgi:8-oxo-dGTP pyrophosphatase MutT (NUDIX family)
MSNNDELEYRSVAGIVVMRNPLNNNTTVLDSGDVHDTNRKPTDTLYLLVKKPREDHAWQFPQGGIKKKKETVSEGALRELSEECGQDLDAKLIDDINPACIYQYDFPPEFVKKKKKKKQYKGARVKLFSRFSWLFSKKKLIFCLGSVC